MLTNRCTSLAALTAIACLLPASYVFAQADETNHNPDKTPIVAMDVDPALTDELVGQYQSLPASYRPRTEHLFDDGTPMFINRLISEDSPYLVQHAHNPVNWYPWGEEAFAAAREQNKPVFLSIGYATCHWCHVMERESFENLEIAQLMNDHYINIKVDREQLPDVDALFMSAVMLINGSGGWPMSSFLDPDGRPFYGATYFPPDRFSQLLSRINALWQEQPANVLAQATQLAGELDRINSASAAAVDIGNTEIQRGLLQATAVFDEDNGGFGGAPKFPREPTLFFLLDEAARGNSSEALNMARVTLAKMAAGGIHDHVGGGFHRYAVDSLWRVPHFEKMLYNQAALGRLFAQAFALTGEREHQRTALRLFRYVLRDMSTADGLFYSATDADSEGEEGLFFVWTPEELVEVLGEEDAQLAKQVWNVTGMGNFEGHSILYTSLPTTTLADGLNIQHDELLERIDLWTEKMRVAREQREHPLRDEKIIASWNGMMISALIDGANYLNEPAFSRAAIKAGNALWKNLHSENGKLYRTYYNAKASVAGTQADYAYVAESFIALYDTTNDEVWLKRALALVSTMDNDFWDVDAGAYYMGSQVVAGAKLSARPKDLADNAIASGNSVALRVLTRLYRRTGEEFLNNRANALIDALSGNIAQQPAGFYYLLKALNEHLNGEVGAVQHAARGNVSATASVVNDDLVIDVKLKDGWHINSTRPLQDYLIATTLTSGDDIPMKNVRYPDAIQRTLGFQRSELSLYEGQFQIKADLPAPTNLLANTEAQNKKQAGIYYAELQLQACDDTRCLAPETMSFQLSPIVSP
ncbi:MAG: thioredoxin domain-containing protein [Granulosicoccus sp.]